MKASLLTYDHEMFRKATQVFDNEEYIAKQVKLK